MGPKQSSKSLNYILFIKNIIFHLTLIFWTTQYPVRMAQGHSAKILLARRTFARDFCKEAFWQRVILAKKHFGKWISYKYQFHKGNFRKWIFLQIGNLAGIHFARIHFTRIHFARRNFARRNFARIHFASHNFAKRKVRLS